METDSAAGELALQVVRSATKESAVIGEHHFAHVIGRQPTDDRVRGLKRAVPLPRQVYVHGFINFGGERLSKSAGNVIDPVEMVQQFGADAVRFYLIDAIATGRDGEFTTEQFVEHVNTHLANKLGNLASRTVTLVHKYFEGLSPAEWAPDSFADPAAREALTSLIDTASRTATETPKAYDELRLNDALEHVWNVVERANEFTDRAKPWESGKDAARRTELATTLSALLETLRLTAIWAWPVMPVKCEQLWTMLGHAGSPGEQRGDSIAPKYGVSVPHAVAASQILFPRIDLKSSAQA